MSYHVPIKTAFGSCLLTAMVAMVAMWGCESSRGGQASPTHQGQVTRLAPIHVRAKAEGEEIRVDAYSARTLFERAFGKFERGELEEAAADYQLIAREFPGSEYAPAALYNLGLCHEQLQRHAEAVDAYTTLLKRHPSFEDRNAALFQLAGSYEQLEQYEGALEIFTELAGNEELDNLEQFEAQVRQGAALRRLGRLDDAAQVLKDATLRFRHWFGPNPSTPVYYYAMAFHESGETLHAKMSQEQLPADEQALEPALERKCQLLLDAQRQYTKSIKVGDAHFASGSAYRIGALYRDLWRDIVNAPAPIDMTEEEQSVYREILEDRVRVLLTKALVQWERTLKMTDRLKLDNEWVSQIRQDIDDIRALLAEPNTPQ